MTRILYLVHRFPYPPNKGDRIRTFNLIRFLHEHCRLDVATLADEPVLPEEMRELSRYTHRLAVSAISRTGRLARALTSASCGRTLTEGAFASPELRALVARWSAETRYDAVLASSSSMVPYLKLPGLRGVPAVADLIDVDSEKWLNYAAASRGPRRWLYNLEARRLRRLERDLPARLKALTLVTEEEADLYRGLCPGPRAADRVHAVGNGVDLDYFQPRPETPLQPTLVFLGAMDYRPNVDGVAWFCRYVWPRLRERFPQYRFQIVGRRPTETVRRLAEQPGVEVTGAVPDVRPYLAQCTAVVAPLQIARGVQNKVLEAMAMARPVAASPEALCGLAARPGEHLVCLNEPEEWIAGLAHLLKNPKDQTRLAAAGRNYVLNSHCWNTTLSPFLNLLNLTPVPEPQLAAVE